MQLESARLTRDLNILAQEGVSAALVDVAPDGILAIDESGRVATANIVAARLLGHSRADIEGHDFIDLLRPSVRGDGMAWLHDVVKQGGFADVCTLRADGALASLHLAVRAIRFDGRLMLACYLRETHRRRRGDPDATSEVERDQRARAPKDQNLMRREDPIVYVIDDDAKTRASLTKMLQHCHCKVQAFSETHTFLAHTRPCVPGCAVLDVEGPDFDRLALQARLAADCSSLPIILIASKGDVRTSVRAMKAGAFEFFIKPLSEHAVLKAVLDAIAFSSATLERSRQRLALQARYVSLTPRERDVMRGVISGLLNKQVASELGISEVTVKAHRGRVMRKMQAHSLAELVSLTGMLGLVSSREY